MCPEVDVTDGDEAVAQEAPLPLVVELLEDVIAVARPCHRPADRGTRNIKLLRSFLLSGFPLWSTVVVKYSATQHVVCCIHEAEPALGPVMTHQD